MVQNGFWDDVDAAKAVVSQLSAVKALTEPVENGQDKSRCLTGTRLGAGDEVSALDSCRDGLSLYFGGSCVAGSKNSLHQRVGKTKGLEWHCVILKNKKLIFGLKTATVHVFPRMASATLPNST